MQVRDDAVIAQDHAFENLKHALWGFINDELAGGAVPSREALNAIITEAIGEHKPYLAEFLDRLPSNPPLSGSSESSTADEYGVVFPIAWRCKKYAVAGSRIDGADTRRHRFREKIARAHRGYRL